MAIAMGVSRLVENATQVAFAFFHLHAHGFTIGFFSLLLDLECQ